jgi:hypothetical protein
MPIGTKGEINMIGSISCCQNHQNALKYYSVNMQKANSIGEQDQGLTPDTEEAFTEYIMKEFKTSKKKVFGS